MSGITEQNSRTIVLKAILSVPFYKQVIKYNKLIKVYIFNIKQNNLYFRVIIIQGIYKILTKNCICYVKLSR